MHEIMYGFLVDINEFTLIIRTLAMSCNVEERQTFSRDMPGYSLEMIKEADRKVNCDKISFWPNTLSKWKTMKTFDRYFRSDCTEFKTCRV